MEKADSSRKSAGSMLAHHEDAEGFSILFASDGQRSVRRDGAVTYVGFDGVTGLTFTVSVSRPDVVDGLREALREVHPRGTEERLLEGVVFHTETPFDEWHFVTGGLLVHGVSDGYPFMREIVLSVSDRRRA